MLQRIENTEKKPDLFGTMTFVEPPATQSGHVALLWKRGVLLEANGRSDEARQTWIALLGLEPSHLGALNRLGGLLAAAGENGLAREVFAEAVDDDRWEALSAALRGFEQLEDSLLQRRDGR